MSHPVLRAKMRVSSVIHHKDSEGQTVTEEVELYPVYGRDGTANAEWSKATPAGHLKLTITNEGAHDRLRRDHEYFVDFTAVTETPDEV